MRHIALVAALLAAPITTQAAGDILTGDPALACEAILCLSSGTRPGECSPALGRYFSIRHRRLGDTIRARFDFLSLCPAGAEPGMPSLLSAISRGAGRCESDYLLPRLNRYEACRGVSDPEDTACDDMLGGIPSYCAVYAGHELTVIGMPTYRTLACDDEDERYYPEEEVTRCRRVWEAPPPPEPPVIPVASVP